MKRLEIERLVRLVKNTNQIADDWTQMGNVLEMITQLHNGAQLFVYDNTGADDDGQLQLIQVEYPSFELDEAYDWVIVDIDEDVIVTDNISPDNGYVSARLLMQFLDLLDIEVESIDDGIIMFNGDTTEDRIEFLNDLTDVLYHVENLGEVPKVHSDNQYTKLWQEMLANTPLELHLI